MKFRTTLMALVVLAAVPATFTTLFPKVTILSTEFHKQMNFDLNAVLKRQLMGELIDVCTRHIARYGRRLIFSPPGGFPIKKMVRTYAYICHEIDQPVNASLVLPKVYKSEYLEDEDYLEMRRIWKNRTALYKLETPMLKECYREIGWFWECILHIRQKFIGIGYGDSLRRMKTDWQSFLKTEVDLIKHCFLYHQEVKIKKCKGLTHDRPNATSKYPLNDRNRFRMDVWDQFVKHIRGKGEATGRDLVMSCFFERVTNAKLHEETCKILWANVKNLSKKPTRVQQGEYAHEILLYEEGAQALKMEDCELYHKNVLLPRCKHWTWDDYEDPIPEFYPWSKLTLVTRIYNDTYFMTLPNVSIPAIPPYQNRIIPAAKYD